MRLAGRISEIFGVIAVCFVEPDAMQLARRETWFDLVPKGYDEIFCGREDALEEIYLFIEIPMIAFLYNGFSQDAFEFAQIDYVTRVRVRLAFHRDLKDVVMPVPTRIIAQAKLFLVPFWTEVRVI